MEVAIVTEDFNFNETVVQLPSNSVKILTLFGLLFDAMGKTFETFFMVPE